MERGICGIEYIIPQCNDILKSILYWLEQVNLEREKRKSGLKGHVRLSDHALKKIIEMRDEVAR